MLDRAYSTFFVYLVGLQSHGLGGAVVRILEADGDIRNVVLAAHDPGSMCSAGRTTTHSPAEKHLEKIAEITTEIKRFCPRAATKFEMDIFPTRGRFEILTCFPIGAELVIEFPLLWVLENLIGLAELFELVFGVLVFVDIGVVRLR